MHALVNVDYDEGDQSTYRRIVADLSNGDKVEFKTGDPIEDYRALIAFLNEDREDGAVLNYVMYASSMDHFIADGDKYKYDEQGYLALA